MHVDRNIIVRLRAIQWFANCGNGPPQELCQIKNVSDAGLALTHFVSANWEDAKTEAQGDLSGYLSAIDYQAYGGMWNNLAREVTILVEEAVERDLSEALSCRGWGEEMLKPIVVDLVRAVMEATYREKFRKAPVFFDTILAIYEADHLPCGWTGDMCEWPEGSILAY